MDRETLLRHHRTSRTTDEPWHHNLAHGTDYCGSRPDTLSRDIVFHERSLGIMVTGLRVSWEDDGWAQFVPSIIPIEYSAHVPSGCAYMIAKDGEPATFIINADVSKEADDAV